MGCGKSSLIVQRYLRPLARPAVTQKGKRWRWSSSDQKIAAQIWKAIASITPNIGPPTAPLSSNQVPNPDS
jgi:hypothetical protein